MISKWRLYWKNIRGVFYTGYSFSNPVTRRGGTNYISPIIVVAHTALLPLTLTVGAGIKTLVDIATRKKPSSESELRNTSVVIDELDTKSLNIISDTILKSNPSSVSSKQLLITIRELRQQEKVQRAEYFKKKHTEYCEEKAREIEDKNPGAHVTYQPKTNELSRLQNSVEKAFSEISRSNAALMKDSIKKYIKSPDNNGKKLHRLLMHSRTIAIQEQKDHKSNNNSDKIYIDDNFEAKIQSQITRLRDNGIWWKFGIGNNTKADRIQDALSLFKQSNNAETMNNLKSVLDARRMGSLTGFSMSSDCDSGHTESYKQVFLVGK